MDAPVFSSSIAWYLFLAGAGSGAFLLAAALSYVAQNSANPQAQEYAQIARGGLYLGPLLVLSGSLFLLFDLGTPQKAFTILFSPQLTVITAGTWLIIAFCATASAFLFIRGNSGFRVYPLIEKLVGAVAVASAAGIILYTGVLFSGLQALPFLNSPLLIVLFALSALSSGTAVISLYGFLNQRRKSVLYGMRLVPTLDIVLVICEALVLVVLILTAQHNGSFAQQASAQQSIQTLLTGELSPLFWLGVVGAGMAIPALTGIFKGRQAQPTSLAATALFVLAGAFALRYCLLMTGQHVDPSLFL